MWYFNVVGGSEERYNLPQKTPNSYTSLGFCAWYVIVDSVSGYNINNTCVKRIKSMFKAKKGSKNTHLKEMDEFLQAELKIVRRKLLVMERSLLKNPIKDVREKQL